MPKIQIFRRSFPAPEGKPNPKQLVATFPAGMENEAETCLFEFQQRSTKFSPILHFDQYRYTLEAIPDPITSASEKEGIQVDTSKAKHTVRPISYQLSWNVKHGECECIAWHEKYGTIRGTVEDSPQGRRLFRHRIMSVWPNADIVAS